MRTICKDKPTKGGLGKTEIVDLAKELTQYALTEQLHGNKLSQIYAIYKNGNNQIDLYVYA